MGMTPVGWELAPGRRVGGGHPCFVIAEIGSNHNQDLELALQLIEGAAQAGVDAVKFQTFRAADHFSRFAPGFSYLNNEDPYALITRLEIDRAWHPRLKDACEAQGVVFLSSPCDAEAIDELHALGMAAFKVASYDLPDLELVRRIAKTGRPVLLSTGMAEWADVQRALAVCRSEGNDRVALLQCTALYPAPVALSNLRAMTTMRESFGVVTGYSDHTEGDQVCLAAAALGASLIEKHITLDRGLPGPDHGFAMELPELAAMVRRIRDVEAALGDGAKDGPRQEETEMFVKGRRSLHARRDIRRGEVITADMVVAKRPGLGIPPYLRDVVVGRVARVDIAADQWITWDQI